MAVDEQGVMASQLARLQLVRPEQEETQMEQKQTKEQPIPMMPKSCCGCCKAPPAREAEDEPAKAPAASPSEQSGDKPA